MLESFRIENLGFFVFFHEPQAIAFTYQANLFLGIEGDCLLKIGEGFFVVFGFQIQLSPVDVGFVVLGVLLEALIQLKLMRRLRFFQFIKSLLFFCSILRAREKCFCEVEFSTDSQTRRWPARRRS